MTKKETVEESIQEDIPAEVTSETEEQPKKRLVRRRKSKKERESPVSQAIRLAVESGKVEFGSKSSVKSSLTGKAKLFVIASNTPAKVKGEISHNAKLSNVPVLDFEGSSLDLGSICGKPYSIAALSIYEVGSSNILDLAKKK